MGSRGHYGTVFKIAPGGAETELHLITGIGLNDGFTPNGNLAVDAAGNLWGSTQQGGAYNYGTVFEISPSGSEVGLYSFAADRIDGALPKGGLTIDGSGTLFGVTAASGSRASELPLK